MAWNAQLRPVTDAEIAVIPWRERFATLAGSGVKLKPTLRAVVDSPPLTGHVDTDLMVAMFAKLGCDTERSLVGSVIVSERARYRMTSHVTETGGVPQFERLIVIDGLTMTELMARWRPPLRTLLVSTAAIMVATTAHDASARTCVACRVDDDDALGKTAVAMLGACKLGSPAEQSRSDLLPGGSRVDNLYFLDTAAAAKAAQLVLRHLDGDVRPARSLSIGESGKRAIEAMLSLNFPRPIKALREEIDLIARGQVELDWRQPAIAINDLDLHLRRAANAGN